MPTKEYIEGVIIEGVMDMIDDDTPAGAFWQMVADGCQFGYPGITIDQIVEILFKDE